MSVPDRPPRGPDEYQEVKALLGLQRREDLLVLSKNHDPYFMGSPSNWRDARWFVEMWGRFGARGHLRRLHYQVLTAGERAATGEPYENTQKCWLRLCYAAMAARALGLVDPEAITDQRNAPPRRNVWARQYSSEPEAFLPVLEWELPGLDVGVLDVPDLHLRGLLTVGYAYERLDQPAVLEVWVEKTTVDDVLVPLCERLGVNLVSNAGFQSITAAVSLLRRAESYGKPIHVLYVSDFDPAGEHMPVTVSRHVQFYREALDIDAEVSVEQVALTAEQVATFELPRAPIKDTDRRRSGFEARHGEGAVELDALEALHPGALTEAVRHAVLPWRDRSLARRLAEAKQSADSMVGEAWAVAGEPIRVAVAVVSEAASELIDGYRQRVTDLAEELAADLAPHRERLERLRVEARLLEREAVENLVLPDRPEATEPEVDRSGLLFDSRRHWWEQLQAFKRGEAAPSTETA